MKVQWTRCFSYDQAAPYNGVVYLHEWDGEPFYWGICDRSVFGGPARVIYGQKWNARYSTGYRHWIEGCLRHGAALYMGSPTEMGRHTLRELESSLIDRYPSAMNSGGEGTRVPMRITHWGDVPSAIQRAVSRRTSSSARSRARRR